MTKTIKKRGGWKRDIRGEKNPMWGKHHSPETIQKISQANIGRRPNSGSFKIGPRMDKRKRVRKNCVTCGKEFEIKLSHASFSVACSVKCGMVHRAKFQRGRKIHTDEFKQRLAQRNWRGGVTPLNRRIRGSEAYKEWRNSVFKRDDFTCQICGQVGGELNADHDLPFSLFPDLRLEVLNGQTFCVQCHRKKPRIISHLLKIHMMEPII